MSCRRIGESLNDRLIRNRLNCRYCCGYPGTFVDGIDEEVTNSANAGERSTANGHIRCPATADANYCALYAFVGSEIAVFWHHFENSCNQICVLGLLEFLCSGS